MPKKPSPHDRISNDHRRTTRSMGGAKVERPLTPAPRDGRRGIADEGISGDRLGRRGSLMIMEMRRGEVPVAEVSDSFELKKDFTKTKEGIYQGSRGLMNESETNAIAGGSIIRCAIGEPGLLTGCRAAEEEGVVNGEASVLINKGAAKPTTSETSGHETQSTTPTRHTKAPTSTHSTHSVQPKGPAILRWNHLTAKYGFKKVFETHPTNASITIATDKQHNHLLLADARQTDMDPTSSPHARMAIENIVNAPEVCKTPEDQLVEPYTWQAARFREAREQTSMNPYFADNGGTGHNGNSMDVIKTTFVEGKNHNIAPDELAGKKLVFGENNTLFGAEKDGLPFSQRTHDNLELMWSKPRAGQFESGAAGFESVKRSAFPSYAHSASPLILDKSQLPYSFGPLPPRHGANAVNHNNNVTQKSASRNPLFDRPIPGQKSDISTSPTSAELKPTFSPFSNNQPPGGKPFIFKQPPPQAKPPLYHPQPFRHNIFEFNPMASLKGTPGKRPQSPVKRNNRQAANTIGVRCAANFGTPGSALQPPVQIVGKSKSPGKRMHVDTGLKTKSPPHKVARAKNVTASAGFTLEVADDTEDDFDEEPKTKSKITTPAKQIAKKEGSTRNILIQSVEKPEGMQKNAAIEPLVNPYNLKNQANNADKSLQRNSKNNEHRAQLIDGAGMRFHIYSVNTSTQSYGTFDANGRMPYYQPVGHVFHLFDLNSDICDQKERLILRPEAFVKICYAGSRMLVAQQVGRYVETMLIVLGKGFDSGEVVGMFRVYNPSLVTQSETSDKMHKVFAQINKLFEDSRKRAAAASQLAQPADQDFALVPCLDPIDAPVTDLYRQLMALEKTEKRLPADIDMAIEALTTDNFQRCEARKEIERLTIEHERLKYGGHGVGDAQTQLMFNGTEIVKATKRFFALEDEVRKAEDHLRALEDELIIVPEQIKEVKERLEVLISGAVDDDDEGEVEAEANAV